LRDLASILSTQDISPQQKSEARVTRGAVYRDLGRLAEARDDLEAVLAIEELFPGTAADALVELGELARLERDADPARKYLDAVTASIDVDDSTLVEALIVRARLLVDAGNTAGAENIWQSVLTNPSASARQRSIAANRGAASRLPAPQ
jgi:hypothetical protein